MAWANPEVITLRSEILRLDKASAVVWIFGLPGTHVLNGLVFWDRGAKGGVETLKDGVEREYALKGEYRLQTFYTVFSWASCQEAWLVHLIPHTPNLHRPRAAWTRISELFVKVKFSHALSGVLL